MDEKQKVYSFVVENKVHKQLLNFYVMMSKIK